MCSLYWLRISMNSKHLMLLRKSILNNKKRKRKSRKEERRHVLCIHTTGYGAVEAQYA